MNKISREINNDVISSLEVAENISLHHHEKWDGTGYPHRLKGQENPIGSSNRCHRGCIRCIEQQKAL
ncbi:HD domain-containing phosphohydrolase [Peribacillus frigoritolerans]|uniref:HD domain-containing phosphohydrolase n=1 Tax=Peribacillus frigoritolerans TaxID=450367 RepID=UPI002163A36E|nr:HD domain-containing phosphohydrolase [Peribacillus frigoritolerans]